MLLMLLYRHNAKVNENWMIEIAFCVIGMFDFSLYCLIEDSPDSVRLSGDSSALSIHEHILKL